MSVTLFRIASDTALWSADDMTGKGAELSGGRWNAVGIPVIYASESRALACLETVVHFNAGGLPLNRSLVEISVPDEIWAAAIRARPDDLTIGWDVEPAGLVSIGYGTRWAAERRSAILLVPSVIVPEETNALLNPQHPDASRLGARKVRRWSYDPRLTVRPTTA